MNRSTPLSPDARRLLELGSHVEPPTSEQDERLDRALATLFRAGRAPASGTGSTLGGTQERAASPEKSAIHPRPPSPPAQRSLESLLGLNGSKLWIAVGALAATASASFWLGRVSTPVSESARDNPMAVATFGPPAPPSIAPRPSEPESMLLPSPASLGSGQGRSRAHARPRAHSAPGLAGEIEQLAQAEGALRQGHPERALLLLEQRSVRHLQEQAAALRAIAECELGITGAGHGARVVLARWPASAFRVRISHACGL